MYHNISSNNTRNRNNSIGGYKMNNNINKMFINSINSKATGYKALLKNKTTGEIKLTPEYPLSTLDLYLQEFSLDEVEVLSIVKQ